MQNLCGYSTKSTGSHTASKMIHCFLKVHVSLAIICLHVSKHVNIICFKLLKTQRQFGNIQHCMNFTS